MKSTIDEETFLENPPPEDDDEDSWKDTEEEINDCHLNKNSVFKKATTWDEWYTECDAVAHLTFVTIRKHTEKEQELELSVKRIPGHALHGKGLQRQKGVGPLVSSQEKRALLVPLINCG